MPTGGGTTTAGPSFKYVGCGRSRHKPFCEGAHARAGFDGSETAPVEPTSTRRKRVEGSSTRRSTTVRA